MKNQEPDRPANPRAPELLPLHADEFEAVEGGFPNPYSLVQWVLRESYMQTVEDLRMMTSKLSR